jgi:hypothetical protein
MGRFGVNMTALANVAATIAGAAVRSRILSDAPRIPSTPGRLDITKMTSKKALSSHPQSAAPMTPRATNPDVRKNR